MRRTVEWLALFVAVGGTAFAAGPLLTGADVKNRSLTGADIRDGTLTTRGFKAIKRNPAYRGRTGRVGPVGPPGPTASPPLAQPPSALRAAFLRVEADGTSDSFSITIGHPTTGTYCVGLPAHTWVDVTSRSLTTAQRVSVVDAACGPPNSVAVTVDAPATPELDDGPFLLAYEVAQ